MKLIGWNCRGLGNGPAVRSLPDLGRVEDPDIVFLAETKMTAKELERFRWMLGLVHMTGWNSEGRSKGVALFWRRGIDVVMRSYGRRHIDVDVREEDGRLWRMKGVYGESVMERKIEMWHTVRILGQQHQDGRPWICLGDFNEILSDDEKVGGVMRPQTMMDNFRGALEACDLTDIGYTGDKYTWRNHSRDINI
ncbi:uncharacterized protein [Aegilops tauschii subsp. strangulata]|uniref:uncharacterized protein n=1 Tax=Aegilops tauschii subsp. strangulata TaxID=200361 RepID=UPI003CC8B92C